MATTDKYDRQVRLWGPNGQKALTESRILMLGVSSAGTETLKNLVLPGAGSFVIVDDAKVTARDTGNDFFVTQESIGELKAKVVCEMMKEMNPDVKEGNFVEASPAKFIEENA
jgi:amyloid beta precursor protein binding protein 1